MLTQHVPSLIDGVMIKIDNVVRRRSGHHKVVMRKTTASSDLRIIRWCISQHSPPQHNWQYLFTLMDTAANSLEARPVVRVLHHVKLDKTSLLRMETSDLRSINLLISLVSIDWLSSLSHLVHYSINSQQCEVYWTITASNGSNIWATCIGVSYQTDQMHW